MCIESNLCGFLKPGLLSLIEAKAAFPAVLAATCLISDIVWESGIKAARLCASLSCISSCLKLLFWTFEMLCYASCKVRCYRGCIFLILTAAKPARATLVATYLTSASDFLEGFKAKRRCFNWTSEGDRISLSVSSGSSFSVDPPEKKISGLLPFSTDLMVT